MMAMPWRKPWRWVSRVVVLTLAALLTACASISEPPQTAALFAATPTDLARHVELRSVPFFPQTPYHCGPAALATALTHAGFKADPAALGDAVFLPAREGSLQLEMLTGARRQGALAVKLPGQLDALMRELADGHPPVVLLNLGVELIPRWHYAVLVGYDLDAGDVVLRSGVTEREVLKFSTFEHTWARSDHWAFVVVRPGDLPKQATEVDATQAVLGLQRVVKPDVAAQAWLPLTQRWPDAVVPLMGLGNTRFAAGDWRGAAQAFEQAAARHDGAAAWNNLAQARHKLGDQAGARAAAERAVARAQKSEPQWLDAAKATLEELR